MTPVLRRLGWIALLVLLDLVIGTAGFVLIDGFPLFDAFYMTVITITTVGYMEIRPLSQAGRLFNSFLLLFGVTTVFFAIGVMTQIIIETELGEYFRRRRTIRMIDTMRNHFIVCGYGRVGRSAAQELQRAGVPFVVVDRDEARVQEAARARLTAVLADSTKDETLRDVGIRHARGLVAALATDADNLFVILSAKTLNPSLIVSTRVSDEEAERKLRRAGADVVFAPYAITGHRLAQSLLRPHVHEFLNFATADSGLNIRIEQVLVSQHSEFASRSLRDSQIRHNLGVIVLAIRKADGTMLVNPPAETVVSPGDHLIAMGEPANLVALERKLTEVSG